MNVSRVRRIRNKVRGFVDYSRIDLEIGCGKNPIKGYFGLDIEDYGQHIIWDVELGIPLPDQSCSSIYSSHTFEHIDDLIGLMNECHRVIRSDGTLHIVVPHKDHERANIPTHIRRFDEWTFKFFEKPEHIAGYSVSQWAIKEIVKNDRGDLHVWMLPVYHSEWTGSKKLEK